MCRDFNFLLIFLLPPQRNEEVVGRSSFPMQFFPINSAALPQEYFFFQKMVSLMYFGSIYNMIQTVMELKVLKSKPGMKAEAALSTVSPVAVCSTTVVSSLIPGTVASASTQQGQMVVTLHCGPSTI